MAEVICTDPALSDLNDIAEYIALENMVAAKLLVQSVFEKVKRLELLPKSGRVPPELSHLNYREVVANPCFVSTNRSLIKSIFCILWVRSEIYVSSC